MALESIITPGLIDAHSHMAGESINEGFQNVTAEVRMRDVIDPNDIASLQSFSRRSYNN